MGELNFFLGLQVLQKKDGIFLSQDKYVGDMLKKFRYSDADRLILLWTRRILGEKTELVEEAMRGSVKGNYIIYTIFVSHIVFGWVLGTSSIGVFLEYALD
nr:ribonuclease H-like domain-containing protein [Tanacetum cinerariifolium]